MPRRHNDGRPVIEELFEQTREDLVAQFGGTTFSPTPSWEFGFKTKSDTRMNCCGWWSTQKTRQVRQFFVAYKSVLLERFDQIEIYIASYPVEIL